MMKLTSYKNTLPNKIYLYFWPLDGALYCTKECRPIYISSFLMQVVMIKLTSYKITLPNKNSFHFWPLEGALYQDRLVPVLKNSRQ